MIILKRVLVVEDNSLIRHGLVNIFESIDEKIQIFQTGYAEEAFTICKENCINLILLDLNLLDYSGLELAKQIRTIKSYFITPIIFVTAFPTKELEAFKTIHCYDYIIKPFIISEVKQQLKNILNLAVMDIEEKKMIKLEQKSFLDEIYQEDIICIEVKYKTLYITTINGVSTYKSYTLNQIMDMLSENFLRCHRSYIINRNFIKGIDKANNLIELKGIKEKIPYGRQYNSLVRGL